jgi:hypothetical protein
MKESTVAPEEGTRQFVTTQNVDMATVVRPLPLNT